MRNTCTMSKRGLLVTLEFKYAGKVDIVWAGDTFFFRRNFDEAEIPGAYDDEDYYRVLRDKDISEDAGIQEVLAIFGDQVLHNAAVACSVAGEQPEDTSQG